MLALQTISAVLLLLNKIYVYKKKTSGWVLGILGTISITAYFYLQMVLENKLNLWIMVVYDCALLVLMIFGYLVSVSNEKPLISGFLKRWNLIFKFTVVSLTTIICLLLLIEAITANLVFIQFFSTVFGLVGTLLLAFNKRTTNLWGWVSYLLAHGFVTYLMLQTGSPIIAVCQVASGIVSIVGLENELKKK